jgi:hypothetical protein
MKHELEKLELPSGVVERLVEMGVASMADFALHLDSPEQQIVFAESAGLPIEIVAHAVEIAREAIPTNTVEQARKVSESPRAWGVLPPDDDPSKRDFANSDDNDSPAAGSDNDSKGGAQ